MKSKEFQKTEYHKIKNYLMMRIFHAGEESVPLPSSYELAKQFHVARATVTKAINILHDEGYIYSKKGIGIFSIPRNNGSPLKLVGFLTGRGKNFYHDYSSWFSVALVGLELTKENCMVKEI